MTSRPFVVLGCPRSGTSLVSGILHKSGVVMSDKFGGSSVQNPSGFWEDIVIVGLNDSILRDVNKSHLEPPDLNIKPDTGKIEQIRKRLLYRARPDGWGFKDPRVILLWRFYEEILRDEFGGAKIIVTHRNPLHITNSWIEYKLLGEIERGLWLANEYERRLVHICATDWPVLHVAFEDWWRRPDVQRLQLSAFVGRALDFSLFDENLWRS